MPEVRPVNGRVVIQIGECMTALSYEQAMAHAEMVELAAMELLAARIGPPAQEATP